MCAEADTPFTTLMAMKPFFYEQNLGVYRGLRCTIDGICITLMNILF